tara:strand:+ start:1052 stop:1627 length:576 start_codon:yes stop_codon:yes gene_type:complete
MIIVGLTGLIGSGKTFALNHFKSKKIKTFSADEEVKKILKLNYIKKKIYKKFPDVFINKKLNKNLLATRAFSQKKNLRILEKILHPAVNKNKKNFLEKNKNKKILILEVPIIFEKKSEKNYNFIILMNVNKKVQKKRVMIRKNMTIKLFKNILKNQISNKKKKIADFIVDNSGPKVKTRKILNKVLEEILK